MSCEDHDGGLARWPHAPACPVAPCILRAPVYRHAVTKNPRGRPPKPDAQSAAERQRRYRERAALVTLQVPQTTARAIREAARARGVSVDALLQEALARLAAPSPSKDPKHRRQSAVAKRTPTAEAGTDAGLQLPDTPQFELPI